LPARRLPESVQTLYAELLDLSLRAEAERAARGLPPGTFVAKTIKGARYWYLQVSHGAGKHQRYLGRESPALLAWMKGAAEARNELADDEQVRSRLCAMLARGGAARASRPVLQVLGLLAEIGVFRRGGVLVGTHAFQTYGNVLGYRFEEQSLRTEDVDIGQDIEIALALRDEPPAEVEKGLLGSGLGFLPVPDLDPRLPATSFKVRGRELRVDFLAAARSPRQTAPVRIPGLGVAAQPLPFLDYLVGETIPAVAVGGSGVLVQVPTPARFALHKLWTARNRPAAEAGRAPKDRRQAQALLEVLLDDRPGDLHLAWEALDARRRPRRIIEAELARLGETLRDRLRAAGLAQR
jgi:hypothetical protein